MTKNSNYDIIKDGLADTSEAPRGKDVFYRCARCGEIIPSVPRDNIGCSCGNVFIDRDYFRLAVEDGTKFQAVRKRKA